MTVTSADFASALSFPKLSTAHSGRYRCEAGNEAATDEYSASLVVSSEYFFYFKYYIYKVLQYCYYFLSLFN